MIHDYCTVGYVILSLTCASVWVCDDVSKASVRVTAVLDARPASVRVKAVLEARPASVRIRVI